MANDLSGIRMQKQIAMGGDMPSGDFGVSKLNSKDAGGPSGKTTTLKDNERGAAPPINGNQANPDHGYK